jgi:hypothetical protein
VLSLGLAIMGMRLLEGIGRMMMCFFAVAYSILHQYQDAYI